jgi:phosphopantetheinyl transferase
MRAMTADVRPLEFSGLHDVAPDVRAAVLEGDLTEPQWMQAQAWLSPGERARFESEPVGRAERFLAGRYLLRNLAAELWGCSPFEVQVSAACATCGAEHGQPRVTNSATGFMLFASLSHAGNAHVAAVSPIRAVGIDIELARNAERALPPAVADLQEWTRMEARSKVAGRGLVGQVTDEDAIWDEAVSLPGFVGTLAFGGVAGS